VLPRLEHTRRKREKESDNKMSDDEWDDFMKLGQKKAVSAQPPAKSQPFEHKKTTPPAQASYKKERKGSTDSWDMDEKPQGGQNNVGAGKGSGQKHGFETFDVAAGKRKVGGVYASSYSESA